MESYWHKSVEHKKEFEELEKDIQVDVCIVGGGLAGLTTAYYLSKQGKKVVVLEKDKICSHTSGHTTGKVTSQHGLFYDYLIQSQGEEYAAEYLEVNEQAIKNIEKIAKEEKIDCDFKKEKAFVFTRTDEDVQKIKDEITAVNKIGKEAEFKEKIPLRLDGIKGAIEFKNQAQFHPVKFAYGLCDAIIKNGGQIYENTKVINTKLNDDEYIIDTEGNIVMAKYLVMTTRYPIKVFPGYYFIKMYQSTSYAIIVDPKDENVMDGYYISSESPTISFRTIYDGNKKLLLIVGYDYKTGNKETQETDNNQESNQTKNQEFKNQDFKNSEEPENDHEPTINGYEALEQIAKSMFPNAEIIDKWVAEDCISLDKIPYIGIFSNLLPNMYVATGFNKWGMTSSNIAANLITDEILGNDNPYADLFKATRVEPIRNRDEVKNMLSEAMKSIVIKKFKKPNNPTCTHLGCELSYNSAENTWDCPCHGSRFTMEGEPIESPAVKNLEEYNEE